MPGASHMEASSRSELGAAGLQKSPRAAQRSGYTMRIRFLDHASRRFIKPKHRACMLAKTISQMLGL